MTPVQVRVCSKASGDHRVGDHGEDGACRHRGDDRDRLRDVTAPTLLLWGESDAVFDRGQQDRLLAALPDARLRVHEDTGHRPAWERPEDVAADVHAFLLPPLHRSQARGGTLQGAGGARDGVLRQSGWLSR